MMSQHKYRGDSVFMQSRRRKTWSGTIKTNNSEIWGVNECFQNQSFHIEILNNKNYKNYCV